MALMTTLRLLWKKECNKAGLLVEVESVDVKIDKSHDLRDPSKVDAVE